MWTLLLLALLVGVRAGVEDGGIIGGHVVAPHSKPWMASLFSKERKKQTCGGALVSRNFVLTAAHCSINHFSDVYVVLGVQNTAKPEPSWQTFRSVTPHSRAYDSKTREHDIVLLKLSKPAVLNHMVQVIPLPSRARDIAAGTVCSVAGWGWTQVDGPMSNVLREVNVTVVDNAVCKEELGLGRRLKDSMLCAGKHNEGKDAGVNDSGGPLVCDGRVEGIVSHGTVKSPPGVYTRVSKYLEWIKKTLGNSG
ncbi:hypothetical protein NDU88_006306 [Pleurodeles waltl]|uniref:Peptidase S1 domain-containing protein n=1 Tax=Pleurodeles waltl TaxID=8319 RepID=A0AAV7L559_PLEWA|nr:hypothetical protein NDU88_006306 [Pleurodeles waltl]